MGQGFISLYALATALFSKRLGDPFNARILCLFAQERIASFTFSALTPTGIFEAIVAAKPATKGLAIDVPDNMR
jgi:hypothetical protein